MIIFIALFVLGGVLGWVLWGFPRKDQAMTDRAKFTLEQAKQYIEAWDRHPALELGGQATVYVHDLLRAMIELARKAGLEGR